MAFDTSQLNNENTPMRWRQVAQYLVEEDPQQLDELDSGYRDVMEAVYSGDYSSTNPPLLQVSYSSGDSDPSTGNFVFNVSEPSNSATGFEYDYNIKEWDGVAPSAPSNPETAWSVAAGQGSVDISLETLEGSHVVFSFDATDAEGESTPPQTYEYVYAPSAPVITASTPGDTEVVIDYTEGRGAMSHTLYYADSATVADVSDLVANGTAVSGFESGSAVTGLTNGTTYAFALVASNPGGTTQQTTLETATPTAV